MDEIEFKGYNPDTGKPDATFKFAKGTRFVYVCPNCGYVNGGGIETENNKAHDGLDDKYSPINIPCVECEHSPMVVEYLFED